MQANIVHWKQKILQNRQECEERNAHLRSEKEHLLKHFQELKVKMTKFRDEQHKRLTELTVNAETCLGKLKENLGIGEGILKLAEACRRYETEREKVLPFYENTGLKGTIPIVVRPRRRQLVGACGFFSVSNRWTEYLRRRKQMS